MRTCKLKAPIRTCMNCTDIADFCDTIPDCKKCSYKEDTYELLQIGTGFWSGDYAMVQKDGVITKVSLSRIYDVKGD